MSLMQTVDDFRFGRLRSLPGQSALRRECYVTVTNQPPRCRCQAVVERSNSGDKPEDRAEDLSQAVFILSGTHPPVVRLAVLLSIAIVALSVFIRVAR